MASFTEQEEERSNRLMLLWSKRYIPLYLVLAAFAGYTVLDLCLSPVISTSTITEINAHRENYSSRRSPVHRTWLVVHLADGITFQMRGGFRSEVGDTLEVESTPLRHTVLSYRTSSMGRIQLAGRYDENNLFPLLVLIVSLLLLLPVRSAEYRWALHGALLLLGGAWVITMIGTEGLTLFK
jgi:hypothetical protein